VSITRIAGLSPDSQAVEARIIEQVSKELDALSDNIDNDLESS
jgi:hypothetical protein